MLSCREVTETASDFLERELRWWPRLQLRMHLMLCRYCWRYVEQLNATMRLMRRLRVERPTSEMEDLLVRRLRENRGEASLPSGSA
jgi:hypothetical protein